MFVLSVKNILKFRKLNGLIAVQRNYTASADLDQFSEVIAKSFTFSPTQGYVRNSPLQPVTIPNLRLDQYIWTNYRQWENHIATVCGLTGRSYTYAKLRDSSAALAIRLQTKFRLKYGDVVAICLPNLPEYPIALLGAIEAGLIVTTFNPAYKPDEIARHLQSSSAKLIFCTTETYLTVYKAVNALRRDIKIVCISTVAGEELPNGAINIYELIETTDIDFSQLQQYNCRPNDTAALLFSSGTTGLPKGVQLSHNNLTVHSEQANVKRPYEPILKSAKDDFQEVLLSVLPFFHVYGLTSLLLSKMVIGAKNVSLARFQPDIFVKVLKEYKPSFLPLIPQIVSFLTSYNDIDARALDSVKYVICGAGPIGVLDIERLQKKAPNMQFMQGYGLTECPAAMQNFPGSPQVGSIGFPPPLTQAKIANINDPQHKGLPPNEQGEILVRGPQNMLGYLNNKDATEDTIVDGWIRTGDYGYYDEDGYFYITDRLKELIKVKGFQVAPAELEEILRNHPSVADVAVVGLKHATQGEVPRAFIVKKDGSDVSADELLKFVADKVAPYKQIQGGVQFLKSIPKNATGKILRGALKLTAYC